MNTFQRELHEAVREEAKWRRRTYFALAVFTAACWWLIISVGIAVLRWMR